MTISISDKDFESMAGQGLVLVDVWATWCGPCKAIAPTVEAISSSYTTVKVFKLDADDNQDFCDKYRIQGIPALIMFKDGKEIDRQVGADQNALLKMVARHAG